MLVSDAGGMIEAQERPSRLWPSHTIRTLLLIDNQVRALRKRQVISSYVAGLRKGAYWGIRSHIADYRLASALPAPPEAAVRLAEVPTRLKRLDHETQERLINWGYAICDAALRKHVEPGLSAPTDFPYPESTLK